MHLREYSKVNLSKTFDAKGKLVHLFPSSVCVYSLPDELFYFSKKMYGGLLQADPSVAERTLPDLPHASKANDMASSVMLLLDTSGCDMHEEEAGGGSRRNEREAEVAVRHVK